MINEQLTNYLLETLPENPDWVNELERQGKEDRVPIMDPLGIQFVMQLIRIQQPAQILEVGTAIGYSALRMLQAVPNTNIITIERDDIRFEQAIKNISKLEKESQISVVHGDALEVMKDLQQETRKFDVIFIDAAKGQYTKFFELAIPLLSEKGMIISDNVLLKGFAAGIGTPNKRYIKMAEKIKAYNQWICQHPDFTTSITPIGDGVAISIKR
ncbi:O-methyltransferase [Ornithinibacillus sp. 4-3]|uniref:tRNA 5-hydroxyuridine methyltransferase n=1 Tax=Ornithinibacillus sp. 4-3 TaxID=3231488 RepID=A0AB39HM05_9BACI